MKPTTLKELAQILDLSISTVSKALNDSDEISLSTRARVRHLAEKYLYTPNYGAQIMKSGKTRNIGVIIPNIIDEFFAMAFQGIEKEASRLNYKIIVGFSGDKYFQEKKCLSSIIDGRVDGIVISLAKETQCKKNKAFLNQIINKGMPTVLFDRVAEEVHCDKVVIDDFDAAYHATKYLLKIGSKKVAFLSTIFKTSVSELRKEGYVQALKLECSSNPKPILINIPNYGNFKSILSNVLKKKNIDAILTADERSAVYTINIIQQAGLKVPDDISVIGFTDGMTAKFSSPPMTMVSQHAANLGKEAVRMVINRIEDSRKKELSYMIVKSKLIVRKSTKKSKPNKNLA